MDMVKERIEQWKLTAEIFLKDNVPAYIRDTSDNLYFCNILSTSENIIMVKCFGPEQRKDEKKEIYWSLISRFDKYNQEEKK